MTLSYVAAGLAVVDSRGYPSSDTLDRRMRIAATVCATRHGDDVRLTVNDVL